jgi:hypothetical protein
MRILRGLILALAVTALLVPTVASAQADQPPFVFPSGCCFYNGAEVRTVVPPSSFPNEGIDPFYGFPSGAASGQKGVVGVAPGAPGYHGGHWEFFAVTWNVTPYLLTSQQAVLDAAGSGDVTVARVPSEDFLCPIQR